MAVTEKKGVKIKMKILCHGDEGWSLISSLAFILFMSILFMSFFMLSSVSFRKNILRAREFYEKIEDENQKVMEISGESF